jgi:NAD(P)-dependent dehydrogenase (short-subunit alcohol dehydrogenase family)
MSMEFAGRTIIVTGGASGIGAAMCRHFAELKAHVVVADLNLSAAQALAVSIDGLALPCDVTKEADIQRVVQQTLEHFGPVDVFVSNAGLGRGQPDHAASAPDEDWHLNWMVHVMAHVYAARAVLPAMIERGDGYLVNVASAAGILNQIGDAAYTATKHAAVSFAESLLITHADDGVGVSVVCPQYVATPLIGLNDSDAKDLPTLLTADNVAASVVEGMKARQFRILPHPVVADYAQIRATNPDQWLGGMSALRRKALRTFGSAQAQDIYKLV